MVVHQQPTTRVLAVRIQALVQVMKAKAIGGLDLLEIKQHLSKTLIEEAVLKIFHNFVIMSMTQPQE